MSTPDFDEAVASRGSMTSPFGKVNDLTPKPSKFSVAIATPAESARTNSIKRAK